MFCPTCSSPLPETAMFCGQCGRAITAADLAAQREAREQAARVLADEARARAEAARAAADAARLEAVASAEAAGEIAAGETGLGVPEWAAVEPSASAAVVPPGTPWWVDSASDDDGAVDDPATADGPVIDSVTADSEAGLEAEAESDSGERPQDARVEPETTAHDSETRGPRTQPEPAAAPMPAPAPLRPPGAVDGARPTSVPLWTASLTPVSGEAAGSPEEAAAAAVQPDPTPEHEASPAGVPEAETVVPGSLAPGSLAPTPSPAMDAGLPPVDEPRPGDTDVVVPLVTPPPVGRAGLHCTVCGAALSKDDIFCGECGTVVESVAQSFTGPITPLPVDAGPVDSLQATDPEVVGSVPEAPAVAAPPAPPAPPASADAVNASGPSADGETVAPREAPLVATPIQAGERLPEPPREPVKAERPRRRLFGRRAAATAAAAAEAEADAAARAAALRSAAPAASPLRTFPTAPPVAVPTPETPASADPASTGGTASADAAAPAGSPAPATPTPASPPLSAERMPHAPAAQEAPAADAPLRATPIDAPPQTATPVVAEPTAAAPASPTRLPWAVGSSVDDVEQTRIVARAPLGDPFVLQFSTGESFTVQGTGLVGRAPIPQPGETIDLLVRIVDPGKSVSKTHLAFGQTEGELWVSDRWSGNGSIVRDPAAEARRLEPGKRVRVPRGARVDIGEQFFIVS